MAGRPLLGGEGLVESGASLPFSFQEIGAGGPAYRQAGEVRSFSHNLASKEMGNENILPGHYYAGLVSQNETH